MTSDRDVIAKVIITRRDILTMPLWMRWLDILKWVVDNKLTEEQKAKVDLGANGSFWDLSGEGNGDIAITIWNEP